MRNLGTVDRLLRVILAELCIIAAFFWAAEEWHIPLYLIAALMLMQAATASCGLYSLLGINRCPVIRRENKSLKAALVAVALILAAAGIYGSTL